MGSTRIADGPLAHSLHLRPLLPVLGTRGAAETAEVIANVDNEARGIDAAMRLVFGTKREDNCTVIVSGTGPRESSAFD